MKRRFRLSKSTDFQHVRRFGKSYAHPLMVLIVSPGQEENSRFGVAAGKTVGSAVRRNRAKRFLRNSVSHFLTFIRPGWDVVIIARKPMVEATLEQTQSALRLLFLRAGLIDETYEARIE